MDVPVAPSVTQPSIRVGFWERVVAFAVDLGVISFANNIQQLLVNSGWVTFVFALVYFVYLWSGQGGGRTWGMRVMGQRVVREDGSTLSLTTSLIRFAGLCLSFLVIGIGVIWVAFDPKKQGWHDKFAGSLVAADAPAAFPAHPVQVTIDPPASPSQLWAIPILGILLKFIVLIPVLIAIFFVGLALFVALVVIWIPVLVNGRYPAWGRDFVIWAIRWSLQINAFVYGLTDRYPVPSSAPDHPVRFTVETPATSSRGWAVPIVGLLAKFVILIPTYVLLSWAGQGLGLVLLIAWAPVLFTGTYPTWAYRFLVAYMRWSARVDAYLAGLTDVYPRTWHWEQ